MKKEAKKTIFIRCVFITLFVSVAILFFDLIGLSELPENMFYDSRMVKTAFTVSPSDEIVVVLIDQDSIDWANEEFGWGWPWQRSAYGDIVRYFDMANAASVVFDVMFTEPSIYGIEDDLSFAQACSDYGHVVQALYCERVHGNSNGWKEGIPLPKFSEGTQMSDKPLLFPIDEVAKSAGLLGNVSATSDRDGTIRRASAYMKYGDYYIPSLGIAPLVSADKEVPNYLTEPKEGRLLRFQSSLDSYVPYNAKQILQSYYAIQNGQTPLLEPELFEDMYVFFGFSAPGLFDICSTPISPSYPGVGVHITQLDNTLQDSFLVSTGVLFTIFYVIFCAFLGCFPFSYSQIMYSGRNIWITSVLFLLCGILIVFVSYLLFALGIVIPIVAPFVSLVSGFVAAIIISYNQEGKQRRYLKSAFKQYLSPAVIENLIEHPEQLSLGGSRKRISIFFSDVQGFTSMSEKLAPEELTSLLNDYLSAMTDIILESGGTIDKYEGDAIIAFWNAPLEQKDHARRALEAAISCQQKLNQIRESLEKRTGCPFYMRIGLNTGDAVVGNMGSRSRFDYTMLGDSVNLAARLEGINKQFGTYCICTKTLKTDCELYGTNIVFRELARVLVVGKKEAVTVYEPITCEEYDSKKETLDIFNDALQLFYSGDFVKARDIFSSIQEKDVVAAHYVQKIQSILENPPNMDCWQGVWISEVK